VQTPKDDFHLGRQVLDRKLVPREALLDCLLELARERKAASGPGFARPLGVVLVARGLITSEQLDEIMQSRVHDTRRRSISELEVGRLLVGAGVLQRDDLERCVEIQDEERRRGPSARPIGEIVVEQGFATEEQVLRVLAYQHKVPFACAGCGARVTAAVPPPGRRYRCKKCGGEMVVVETPAAGESVVVREAEQEDQQFEIDRAVAAYLMQKALVRRDQLRDAQRLQLECSRYGLVVPLRQLLRRIGALTWQQDQALDGMNFEKIVSNPEWKAQAMPGFKLLQRIASGGFATIYSASPLFGGPSVAIKMLHGERAKNERAVQRFEHEARLLRRLNHPNIIRGLEYGCERGQHYLVMEFVEGRSLGQALSEGGSFPLRNALKVARQIADALRYLHTEGYIHRDIKPDNVLLAVDGQVKLCDLGFAGELGAADDRGRAATVVGTKGYMAPEQATGAGDVKVGADIYALGITLYALLTGFEPFKGASSEEVVTEQIDTALPVPNLMIVKAPPPVVQLLSRMMHPDRRKRFATVVDVLKALEPLLA